MALEDLMNIKREIENSDAMQRNRELRNLVQSVYEQTIDSDFLQMKRQLDELCNSIKGSVRPIDVNVSISPALESAAAAIKKWSDRFEFPGFKVAVERLQAAAALASADKSGSPTEFDTERIVDEEVIQAFSSAVEVALPYVPEETQTVYTAKANEAKTYKRLSFSDIVSLLGLLWAIVSTIIAGIPDEQLDRISAQQEVIINQQAALIELETEDAELVEKLAILGDAIYALSDEVEALREQQEAADDASNASGDEANGSSRLESTCVE